MLVSPSEQQIVDDIVAYLKTNTALTNFEDGSIAKGIVVAIAKQMRRQYQVFEIRGYSGLLSTSTGMYLDLVGELVNCLRLAGESDDNYRYRIAHQINIVASSNELAIEFRLLTITGVKQVIIKNYARGIGTFDVFILTDDPITPASILSEAQVIINESAAEGISGRALSPIVTPIDIKVRVSSKKVVTPTIKTAIRTAVNSYIDSLKLGNQMILDQVTKAILTASSDIIEISYENIKVNNRLVMPSNYSASSDERLYLKDLIII